MAKLFQTLCFVHRKPLWSAAALLVCSAALPVHAQVLTGFGYADERRSEATQEQYRPSTASDRPAVEVFLDDWAPPTQQQAPEPAQVIAEPSEPAVTIAAPATPSVPSPLGNPVEISSMDDVFERPSGPRLTGPPETRVSRSKQVQEIDNNVIEIAPEFQTAQNSGVTNRITPKSDTSSPVDLQADNLSHNEETRTITATGNVILEQDGRILKAREISYNLANDTVFARGDVELQDANGDMHFAEEVELNEKLKNGFIEGLYTVLADGSQLSAAQGERRDGNTTVMRDATYTACEPCESNPDASPAWRIVASEVTHDQEDQNISYRNARLEAWGVPIAYTPYFSHPDGTVEQKSGFLSPSFGFKTNLGAFLGTKYYIAIDESQDATVGLTAFSQEAPLGEIEYRKRWDNARLEIQTSLTSSQRRDSEAGVEVIQDDEPRGHVFAEGLWDINNKWRAGLDVEWASDDQFLRQYDITGKDVLTNIVYLERFSGRDYAQLNLQTFQDLRVEEEQVDQPEVLPEFQASFMGEPDSVPLIGGRWNAGASFLGLRRSGAEQDVSRLSGELGWQRRFVSDLGILTTADLSARTDFYKTRDREEALLNPTLDAKATETRFFPQAHIQSSLPLVRNFKSTQVTIEPTVALTLAPNINSEDDDIPNEDSQDVQLDALNVFEPNRFSGKDLVEDRSRVTYGVRSGIYDYNGNKIDAFLGQSIRFQEKDNPFPVGSGLDVQESDFVGQVAFNYINPEDSRNRYTLDYRMQLDGRSLNSERHEIDALASWNRFSLNSRYLFATALGGTDILESREQLDVDTSFYFTPEWRGRIGGVQDFGDDDDGLRKAYVGIDYFGQCLFLSLTGVRNLTRDTSGDSDTDILFRIGLRNLGDFPESSFRVDPRDN